MCKHLYMIVDLTMSPRKINFSLGKLCRTNHPNRESLKINKWNFGFYQNTDYFSRWKVHNHLRWSKIFEIINVFELYVYTYLYVYVGMHMLSSSQVIMTRVFQTSKLSTSSGEMESLYSSFTKLFCSDVALGHMNGVPNEAWTHSWRFDSLAC